MTKLPFHIFSLLFFRNPEPYLSDVPKEPDPGEFWEEEFEYRQDPLWGLWDIAHPPEVLLEKGRGDCTDFARYGASWAYHHTDNPIWLVLYLTKRRPPGHMLAYDGERIYSSNGVWGITPETYKERTQRDLMFTTRVR